MPKAIRLSDGRIINIDHISLVSSLVRDNDHAAFHVEFNNSTKIVVQGEALEIARDYADVSRAIGVVR
ncbi:hypothetical protein QY702_04475 [Xanthomonas campestris pv. plantaginis]|uniref:hypothetical protein n=1 Tax=Xanthomonas campestris TaxID=339 RepID=UPI002B23BC0E|nr:hypothetical protein [Xanthomonas campestris]MEA9605723.1 hypothetical protein [Xanthomonas campestris pv. plantaginis]